MNNSYMIFVSVFVFIFRPRRCTIMQGIRCACRRASSVAQLVLGKQRQTFANSRWTQLTYQPAANFHSRIGFYCNLCFLSKIVYE